MLILANFLFSEFEADDSTTSTWSLINIVMTQISTYHVHRYTYDHFCAFGRGWLCFLYYFSCHSFSLPYIFLAFLEKLGWRTDFLHFQKKLDFRMNDFMYLFSFDSWGCAGLRFRFFTSVILSALLSKF